MFELLAFTSEKRSSHAVYLREATWSTRHHLDLGRAYSCTNGANEERWSSPVSRKHWITRPQTTHSHGSCCSVLSIIRPLLTYLRAGR